jgi:DNA-binding SARP family transcriptional activator
MMEFGVLGPLEVRRDGRAVPLAGGKPRAVLALLLLHPNEPVGAERLAVALFGEDAPPGALGTVRVYVSRLRRALGDDDLVATSRAGYRLRVRPGELDLERFERLVREGRRALTWPVDGTPSWCRSCTAWSASIRCASVSTAS